jgi:hypothetical protein
MKIFGWIRNLFLKVHRVLKPIFLEVFDRAFQALLVLLKDIAIESIKKMAATDMSNEQKRNIVFNDIKRYAVDKLITVSDTQILLIIQIFYAFLKKRKEV